MISDDQVTPLHPCMVQVNVHDLDLPVARHVLPQQMEALGEVGEFRITVNRYLRPADGGVGLDRLLSEVESLQPNTVIHEVDYSNDAITWVSETLFGGAPYGLFDWKGTPIHAYLEPLRYLTQPFFMHIDSDVFIGGSARNWIGDAIDALDVFEDVCNCAPLSGPPSDTTFLTSGERTEFNGADAWLIPSFGGRVYLTSAEVILGDFTPLPTFGPSQLSQRLRGRLTDRKAMEYLERLMDAKQAELGRTRIDLLGRHDGAWSLHLPTKGPEVTANLERVAERVRSNDIPAGQLGDPNLNASLCPGSRMPNKVDRLKAILSLADGYVSSLKQGRRR